VKKAKQRKGWLKPDLGYILATHFVSASLPMERVKGIEPSYRPSPFRVYVLPGNRAPAQLLMRRCPTRGTSTLPSCRSKCVGCAFQFPIYLVAKPELSITSRFSLLGLRFGRDDPFSTKSFGGRSGPYQWSDCASARRPHLQKALSSGPAGGLNRGAAAFFPLAL